MPRTPCALRRHAALSAGRLAWALALAAALGGCAGVLRIENDVRSFTAWEHAAPAGGTALALPQPGDRYRFERRPSQTQGAAADGQARLEALASVALERLGLRQAQADEPRPVRWTVELGATGLKLPHAPWEDPWPGMGLWGRAYATSGRGRALHTLPLMRFPPTPYHQRELTLVLRDAGNGRVVFESQATHDGPWADSPAQWSALIDAALDGFPQPPLGPRRVVIDIPR